MDATLLNHAATQAKTSWLEKALIALLPQVWNLTTQTSQWQETASNWAEQIDQLFKEKRLTTPIQQKNRRTDIANALRIIDPTHPAIPFVLLPTSAYTAMNNEQASRLNARENKFFSTQQANELVQRAIALLNSDNPDNIAAGLSVLVGRRISEILLSHFKPKTAYSLLFSEAVKRRGEVGLEFEIPTLAPANQVLKAITHLKEIWTIEDIKVLNFSNNHLKRRINAKYSGVPNACRKHFADLVPGREAQTDNGDRLYTHLFRAVYAEIAAYYYKPQWVPDHRFKAEIQGHFKLSRDGQKIPNYSARQNYDDYLIRDRVPGKPGVKLQMSGVEILEVFQKETAVSVDSDAEAVAMIQLETGAINSLLYRAVDRLLFSTLWAEAVTGLLLVSGRAFETLLSARPKERSQFSIWVDGLEVPTLTSASQVITAWQKFAQLPPVSASQVEPAIKEVCDVTFTDLAPVQSIQDLRSIYSAIALHWFCPPQIEKAKFLRAIGAVDPLGFEPVSGEVGVKLGQRNVQVLESLKEMNEQGVQPQGQTETIASDTPQSTKLRHHRKTLAVDAELLRTAAASFGFEIRSKGSTGGLSHEEALTQMLSQIAKGELGRERGHLSLTRVEDEGAISAIKDQAKTLAWLTGRVEGLEQQVEMLKQERDQALAQRTQLGDHFELEQMRQENEQLKQECDQATRKLQAFRQLLNEEETNGASITAPLNEPLESQISTDVSTASSETSAPVRTRIARKRMSQDNALQHIHQAIYAIMAMNDQPSRAFKDKWYISFPVVQSLLRANGLSANQKNVADAFDQLKQVMQEHHDKHAIGSRHNRKHPNINTIAQLVNLDLP